MAMSEFHYLLCSPPPPPPTTNLLMTFVHRVANLESHVSK